MECRYLTRSNDGSKERSRSAAGRLLAVVFTWSRSHDWVTGAIAAVGLWFGAADHVAIEEMTPQLGKIVLELHGIEQEIALRPPVRPNENPRQPTAVTGPMAPEPVVPPAAVPQAVAPPLPAPQAAALPAPVPQAGYAGADIMAHSVRVAEANLTLQCYGRASLRSGGLPHFFSEMAACLTEGDD